METTWDKVVKVLVAIGGWLAGLFGGWSAQMGVLIGMMAADYVSGMMLALLGKSPKTEGGGPSSKVGAQGIAKKFFMLLVVLAGALVDQALGTGTTICRDAAIWFYIANEGLSLLENVALSGLPFPQKLKDLLEQAREKQGKPPDDEINIQ